MARRKARMPQGKKIQPAVKTMLFNITESGASTIDLSQCASLLNRRFYRQGLNWAVAGFTFITTGSQTGNISVAKVPDTWVSSNSWEKGFRTWQRMNKEATDESPSIRPKFLDFKVFMDQAHHQAGEAGNLLPLQGSPATALTAGEWEYSTIVVPVTPPGVVGVGEVTSRDIVWTGPNYPGASAATTLDAVSLIEGYAASRGLPDIRDPNAPADAADADGGTPENWIAATFNDGTEQDDEVLGDMITENNIAPYPFENDGTNTDTMYPGGANQPAGAGSKLEIHDVVGISATTIGNITKMNGTNFQGGLIRIDTTSLSNVGTGASALAVLVHLVPGSHRGYMCQAMQDV